MNCDVCVIGTGPAGLTAAVFAAEAGANVVIVDKNTVAGRKLLRTGRGRCNLTHTGSISDFVKAYGKFGRFLKHSLHEFSPEDVRGFFRKLGLETKVEKGGCVFPITERGTDVCRVMVDKARRLGIRFVYGRRVSGISRNDEGFVVDASGDSIRPSSVILATGGVSWPFTGSTGDGYEFARAFGHEIAQPMAALLPLVTVEDWPVRLRGAGVGDVRITAKIGSKKITVGGPIIFTDDGIGGPSVFDLSREITEFLAGGGETVKVRIDLLPELDRAELDELIISRCGEHPKREVAGVLAGILPRSLLIHLCSGLDESGNILASHFTKKERNKLVKLMKGLPLTIKATRPIAEATITRGGVSTKDIDPKTMQSKLCPGLFFAGEVLNVDGPCGGYNLQIAWSTGALAGKCAAK